MPLRRLSPLLLLALACGGSSGGLEPRFTAVHNAMSATGLAQTGPISQGSLENGASAELEVQLPAGQCATFVALGSSGVDDLSLVVTSPDGEEELGRDVTHDRHAAAQVCPSSSGPVRVVLTMAEGAGGYLISSWSSSLSSVGPLAHTSSGGTCAAPMTLEFGAPVSGDTTGMGSALVPPCVPESNSPEAVYQLEVTERAAVEIHLQSSFDGVLYMLQECAMTGSALDCNDDDPDTSNSRVRAMLELGTYYVVVDGYGQGSGTYTLTATQTPLRPVADICAAAPTIATGQPITGDTSGGFDYFQVTCAGGARSPDQVYRFEVPQRSRFRIRQQSSFDGALYVRSSCSDPNSEIVCNDDFMGTSESLVTGLVDAGTYFVYADGFARSNSGQFGFQVDLGSPQGGGASSDSCGGVETLTPGQPVRLDTLDAADDFTASCGGAGAPDVVYALQLSGRSRVDISLNEAEFEGVLSLRRACDSAQGEISCQLVPAGMRGGPAFGPAAPGSVGLIGAIRPAAGPAVGPAVAPGGPATPGRISETLDAGTYYVVVDSQRPDLFGAANLSVEVTDIAALQRTCTQAPILRAGRTTRGSTRGETPQFTASCAGGAQSPDTVYRVRLNRRSRVRVEMDTTAGNWDGALHLRRDCADPSSELVCNDDVDDNRHSRIETTLDRGTYYLIVDGFSSGNEGDFELRLETSNP